MSGQFHDILGGGVSATLPSMITVGVDEVGRGCLAGPLVAGAVIFNRSLDGMRDSKELTKAERERLAVLIHKEAQACGIGWVTPGEIDTLGLTAATSLAMRRAVGQLKTTYDEIIIDGIINYLREDVRAKALVKADATVPVVGAASIIAKVARDAYMAEAAREYPEYGFDLHVGYGTRLHMERLKLHGVSALHRRSFKPVRELL